MDRLGLRPPLRFCTPLPWRLPSDLIFYSTGLSTSKTYSRSKSCSCIVMIIMSTKFALTTHKEPIKSLKETNPPPPDFSLKVCYKCAMHASVLCCGCVMLWLCYAVAVMCMRNLPNNQYVLTCGPCAVGDDVLWAMTCCER